MRFSFAPATLLLVHHFNVKLAHLDRDALVEPLLTDLKPRRGLPA